MTFHLISTFSDMRLISDYKAKISVFCGKKAGGNT